MSDLVKLFLLPLPLFVLYFCYVAKKVGIKSALLVTLFSFSLLAGAAFFVGSAIFLILSWIFFVLSL